MCAVLGYVLSTCNRRSKCCWRSYRIRRRVSLNLWRWWILSMVLYIGSSRSRRRLQRVSHRYLCWFHWSCSWLIIFTYKWRNCLNCCVFLLSNKFEKNIIVFGFFTSFASNWDVVVFTWCSSYLLLGTEDGRASWEYVDANEIGWLVIWIYEFEVLIYVVVGINVVAGYAELGLLSSSSFFGRLLLLN